MSEPGGWVSNELLAQKLDTVAAELKMLRQELVRRDVYDAERRTDEVRMTAIEQQLQGAAANKRQVTYALIGAGLSLLVSVALRFVG